MPKPLADVVAEGDRRASLEALRDTLAQALDEAEPKDVAALALRLSKVLEELDNLPAWNEGDGFVDQLKAKRANRMSDPKPAG